MTKTQGKHRKGKGSAADLDKALTLKERKFVQAILAGRNRRYVAYLLYGFLCQ